jgi:hypothetical protein
VVGHFPPDGGGAVELFRRGMPVSPICGPHDGDRVVGGIPLASILLGGRWSPPRRFPWSGGASAAVGGRSSAAVAGGRSSRLPQGRSDEPPAWGSWAAPSRQRCVVLASSPRSGPHGGGDGEPWAGGWLILGGGGVRRDWHGGTVSLMTLSVAPPLAPSLARD